MPRQTRQQAWDQMQALELRLQPLAPSLAPSGDPVHWFVESELRDHGALIASRVAAAVDTMASVQDKEKWIAKLLTSPDRNLGFYFELHGYGVLAEQGFVLKAPGPVTVADTYRTGSPTTVVELDGEFHGAGVFFDMKGLACPGGILGRLSDDVNTALEPLGKFVMHQGTLDFDHRALGGANYGAIRATIVQQATGGAVTIDIPNPTLRFIVQDLRPGFRVTGEGSFNAYRYALENRHIAITHAEQVLRAKKFVFVLVYGRGTSVAGMDPERSERALARRLFVELTRSPAPAQSFCPNVDPSTTVAMVARSIGGLVFVNVSNVAAPEIRLYTNPNAAPGQELGSAQVEWMSDFSAHADDFAFDNY